MRNGVLERVDNVKRGRGRPKLTWDESVKRDLRVRLDVDIGGLGIELDPIPKQPGH